MKRDSASIAEIIAAPSPPTPGIHKAEEKPEGGKKRKILTYSINRLKLRKYESIELGDYYTPLMGTPEPRFTMMLYGPPGSGKTTFAYKFSNFLAKRYGKVLYASYEEGIKKTVVDRLDDLNVRARRMWFSDAMGFEDLMDVIRKNRYRFVFIDSVQYMGLTFDQLQELRATFRKRLLSVIMISFGNTWGNPDKARELLYASDIKMFFDVTENSGIVKSASRYLKEQVKTKLFSLNEKFLELNEVPEELEL